MVEHLGDSFPIRFVFSQKKDMGSFLLYFCINFLLSLLSSLSSTRILFRFILFKSSLELRFSMMRMKFFSLSSPHSSLQFFLKYSSTRLYLSRRIRNKIFASYKLEVIYNLTYLKVHLISYASFHI